jgi:hypothetical protein
MGWILLTILLLYLFQHRSCHEVIWVSPGWSLGLGEAGLVMPDRGSEAD